MALAAPARAVSWTEVCNRALAALGQSRIESYESDPGQAADYCRLFLEESINSIAIYHPWRSTRARIELARDATAPVSGYDYRFALPTDYLALASDISGPIVSDDGDGRVPFEIEGNWLLTDSETIWIVYQKTPATPVGYPPAFIKAISYALAERMATILTSNENVHALCMAEKEKALKEALRSDAGSGYILPAAAERGYEYPDEAR